MLVEIHYYGGRRKRVRKKGSSDLLKKTQSKMYIWMPSENERTLIDDALVCVNAIFVEKLIRAIYFATNFSLNLSISVFVN